MRPVVFPEPPPRGGRKLNTLHVPHRVRYPELTEEQILAWADAHFARTGTGPSA